jgi:type IV fimbrial biogenesis protein FimT
VLDQEEGGDVLTPLVPARAARKPRGFTLIELLVSVAVVSAGAVLVAPSVGKMVANRRVQSAAQNLLDGLNNARAEALRRNAAVRFQLDPQARGWAVVQVDSGEKLQSYKAAEWSGLLIEPGGAATTVTFLPNGLRQPGTQLSQITVSAPAGENSVRRINVFGGGLVRMCDPGVTVANDPRRC